MVTLGDVVLYTHTGGQVRAAVVIHVVDGPTGLVHLAVFSIPPVDGTPDIVVGRANVAYDPFITTPATWHFQGDLYR